MTLKHLQMLCSLVLHTDVGLIGPASRSQDGIDQPHFESVSGKADEGV